RSHVMALLERVATLLRANLNDLIDRAEDPQKMLRQLILDMENQLLQVKTQVAIALADQHLLEKKQAEHEESAGNWQRKAALAVTRQQDDLARAALRQQISHQQMAASFAQQLGDQRTETDTLRTALSRLQQRLQETQSRCELLAVEHRRARASQKLNGSAPNASATISRVRGRIDQASAAGRAQQAMLVSEAGTNLTGTNLGRGELSEAELEERFAAMEREDQIEDLLRELKAQHGNQDGQHKLPSPA
ncbi:MAG TPA: PspA/IM30 family protein, partial [Acidobacteriaceae bacterium]|nr:PspA/IM30 family protein [Acidobacteriaceae bacterium]